MQVKLLLGQKVAASLVKPTLPTLRRASGTLPDHVYDPVETQYFKPRSLALG
jgi:hypothetical protein